jgi:hypothetical protein
MLAFPQLLKEIRKAYMISVEPLVGSVLGEYQIERLLGQSQLGAAYIAQQIPQGRTVMS